MSQRLEVEKIEGGDIIVFELGGKQSILRRAFNFAYCVIYLYFKSESTIYLPRSTSLDFFIVYKIFGRNVVLLSDGLSDVVSPLEYKVGSFFNFKYMQPVHKKFHIGRRKIKKKQIYFDKLGPIAVFNKRGRDPDYVSKYVAENVSTSFVVNPDEGGVSIIYSAPSTVLFEIEDQLKNRIFIVKSCHCEQIPPHRRALLEKYEDALSALEFNLV